VFAYINLVSFVLVFDRNFFLALKKLL
jgi:hypothetical protein